MFFLMIRAAEESDFPIILDMCEEFWQETAYDEPFDRQHTKLMVEMALDHGLLAVVDESGVVGFVAGIKGPLMASPSVQAGTELAWWINPEHRKGRKGIDLMLFIENLAKNQGIKYWNMISMESSKPEVANAIYAKLGYTVIETSWAKVL